MEGSRTLSEKRGGGYVELSGLGRFSCGSIISGSSICFSLGLLRATCSNEELPNLPVCGLRRFGAPSWSFCLVSASVCFDPLTSASFPCSSGLPSLPVSSANFLCFSSSCFLSSSFHSLRMLVRISSVSVFQKSSLQFVSASRSSTQCRSCKELRLK